MSEEPTTETMTIAPDWQPVPANINALPFPVRRYIHDLSTHTDPAGDLWHLWVAQDTVAALQVMVVELEAQIAALTQERDELQKALRAGSTQEDH